MPADPGASAGDAAAGRAVPLDAAEFERRMAALGPFEAAPRLAVAVSGGADSLALVLLSAAWAADRGGRVDALTVDHGLRPESAAEAARVGALLASRGIPHTVLRWEGSKPSADVQAAARAARYALLEGWCADRGVLHLLLAHHREDQAETLLLRLGRGSGLAGLAGMPSLAERRMVRLLRPLLDVAKARLAATVAAHGLPWLSDPSNVDARFDRVRVRGLLPLLAGRGIPPERLAAAARHLGRARQAIEGETARALAACVSLRPEGYALLDRTALGGWPAEVRLRALAALTACIGGRDYPPRLERLERLHDALLAPATEPATRTLGGCLFRAGRTGTLVCREPAACTEEVLLTDTGPVVWDRRFRLTLSAPPAVPLRVAPLGAEGWRRLAADAPGLTRGHRLPAPVRATLPALWNSADLLGVPHLEYGRVPAAAASVFAECRAVFEPPQPLSGAGFMLV